MIKGLEKNLTYTGRLKDPGNVQPEKKKKKKEDDNWGGT